MRDSLRVSAEPDAPDRVEPPLVAGLPAGAPLEAVPPRIAPSEGLTTFDDGVDISEEGERQPRVVAANSTSPRPVNFKDECM
jgi:hypothetical protein